MHVSEWLYVLLQVTTRFVGVAVHVSDSRSYISDELEYLCGECDVLCLSVSVCTVWSAGITLFLPCVPLSLYIACPRHLVPPRPQDPHGGGVWFGRDERRMGG